MRQGRLISLGTLGVKLARERLSQQTADQLQQSIVDGTLVPGDRLPAEREIADSLGVSRTVVREAIKLLEQRGLLRVLAGSGTYVAHPDASHVANSVSLLMQQHAASFQYLFEVRSALEVAIAGFAAQRANADDIEYMESVLRRFEELAAKVGDTPSVEMAVALADADLAFHSALAAASHNPLLPALLAPITDLLLDWRRATVATYGTRYSTFHHTRILGFITDRDDAGAREAMRQHLASGFARWQALHDQAKEVETHQPTAAK
jgi:GntR family transcriptional regulator, transcriptional repressor for pyruvate dehydrogenase complex